MSYEFRPVLAPLEKAKAAQSLVGFLQGLEGMVTTVELRNDSTVTGKIEHVDAFMCVIMRNATLCDPYGKTLKFTDFFVHGSHVRYIQIPDHVNIMKTIERKCSRAKQAQMRLRKENQDRVKTQERKMERKEMERKKEERSHHEKFQT